MRCVNDVTLLGRLGSDPEVRSTRSDVQVANLSVATNRRYKTDDGWKTDTEWHRVVAWRYEAEKAGELRKGDPVVVQGRLERDEWTDDEGRDRETVKVVARRLIGFADRDQGDQGGTEENARLRGPADPEDVRKPSREEKRIAGATERGGDYSEFTDDALLGDDDLPF